MCSAKNENSVVYCCFVNQGQMGESCKISLRQIWPISHVPGFFLFFLFSANGVGKAKKAIIQPHSRGCWRGERDTYLIFGF